MFDNWTYLEWLILAIDVLAVIIVVRFLSNKIKKKLHEVEFGKIIRLGNEENKQNNAQISRRRIVSDMFNNL